MTITVHHRVERLDLGLGLVRVKGIRVGPSPAALAEELERWIARRHEAPLSPEEEQLRKGGRDILRNGSYKPTGRGKPATEYLMRAAREESFPRINGPVDANNLVSLKHCVAISLWDLDRAGAEAFEFRLGEAEERYVFNPAGQVLDLKDLVCGCGLLPDESPSSSPMVTPIKDSMATKIQEQTTRIAGCIYYPLQAGNIAQLKAITEELLAWLSSCADSPSGSMALCGGSEGTSASL
jgi:DNA/RNA-binding domain of Phe-tRNA-synthetase-like protein